MIRRIAVVGLVLLALVHGVICLTGAARGLGGIWLVAGLLSIATAAMVVVDRRRWWIVGGLAVVVSQAAIVSAWSEAAAGTVVNVLLALAVAYGWFSQGPASARARFRRAVAAMPGSIEAGPLVTEADLDGLPAPVAAYVRRAGSVGRPRVGGFRARISGRIRGGPDQPWMSFNGEQASSFTPEVTRYFLLDATMKGLPVDVLHVLEDGHAAMRARLLSVVPVVDATGPDLDRAEAVTVFNDLCVLAPAALIGAPIRWESIDDHRVRGTYTWAGHAVSATLVFDDAGDLVDFVSDDRLAASPDGRTFTRMRWSTPLHEYRDFGNRRGASRGEGRWHPESGDYAYLEMRIDDLTMHGGTLAAESDPGRHNAMPVRRCRSDSTISPRRQPG